MLKEKGKKAAHLRISFFQPLRNWGLPGNVGVYATVLPAAVVCCAVCVWGGAGEDLALLTDLEGVCTRGHGR